MTQKVNLEETAHSAYSISLSKGILPIICSHMLPAVSGFNQLKPATLYYISINDGEAYKIGITNRTTMNRLSHDKPKVSVISEWWYELRL